MRWRERLGLCHHKEPHFLCAMLVAITFSNYAHDLIPHKPSFYLDVLIYMLLMSFSFLFFYWLLLRLFKNKGYIIYPNLTDEYFRKNPQARNEATLKLKALQKARERCAALATVTALFTSELILLTLLAYLLPLLFPSGYPRLISMFYHSCRIQLVVIPTFLIILQTIIIFWSFDKWIKLFKLDSDPPTNTT